MNKPTLDDFLQNPSKAIKKGYKPDFMSIGALVAKVNGNIISQLHHAYFNYIVNPYYDGNLFEVLKSISINLILFIIALFVIITGIPLFPFYWILIWIIFKMETLMQAVPYNKLTKGK